MRRRVGSKSTLFAVVLTLAVGAGCGGGGGGGGEGNDDQAGEATPTPMSTLNERTPTPQPTNIPQAPTPTGTAAGTTPEPSDTAAGTTPEPTATPATVATTVRVDFTVTTQESLLGFQFTAVYPTATGSFTDSGARVHCPLGPSGIFAKNDLDDGNLILAAANTSAFPHAFNISCTFDVLAGRVLTPGDVAIAVTEVTLESGAVGDPATLTVTVDVS